MYVTYSIRALTFGLGFYRSVDVRVCIVGLRRIAATPSCSLSSQPVTAAAKGGLGEGPQRVYQERVDAGKLLQDDHQESVVSALQHCYDQVGYCSILNYYRQ